MTDALDMRQPPRIRPQPRIVEVGRTTALTPRMRRVTLAGDALSGFARAGAAGHVRVWIPNADGELLTARSAPDGADIPAEVRSPSRVYTPRHWSPERLELDLDIVLHGVGPLSTWAAQAAVGDRVAVAGPGGVYTPDPAAQVYVLAGDEAAIPAIATLLETLDPRTEVHVTIEVEDANDEQSLPEHPKARVRWLHRGAALDGAALANALLDAPLPEDREWRAWVACEATAVRVIRRQLLARASVNPNWLHTRGYWKHGAANHPDHDMGTD
jgi:NADPH-dependent ferric siderophore reductase